MQFIVAGGLNMFANWKQVQTAAIEADQLGYWGFVLPDHYMWGPDRGGDSTLETWTALTYLASKTEKIRLGTLATPIPFRPPGMLAKTVSTLDLLSNGRTILGVGAGWSQTEFEGYSEWSSNKIRVDKTREGLDLILKLWTQEKVDFKGKFYHAKGAARPETCSETSSSSPLRRHRSPNAEDGRRARGHMHDSRLPWCRERQIAQDRHGGSSPQTESRKDLYGRHGTFPSRSSVEVRTKGVSETR